MYVPPDPEHRILHGLSGNEDAVIAAPPPEGMVLVQSVDILGAFGNNPRLFGQTAAANALSDIYAMGGIPWTVMNIAAFPTSGEGVLSLTILSEIIKGAMQKAAEAGAVLAGGHTLDDEFIKFGLSVTGAIDPNFITKNNALCEGDELILTKPLGTGVLATAVKAKWRNSDKGEEEMYRWSTKLNKHASEVIRAMQLRAATDITGFGLGGHLLEMAKASEAGIEIDSNSIPFMPYTLDFASDGLIPAGAYKNREHCLCHTVLLKGKDDLASLLAFDPQTSGGIVLAVSQERKDEAMERLHFLGEEAYCIGSVRKLTNTKEQLIIA